MNTAARESHDGSTADASASHDGAARCIVVDQNDLAASLRRLTPEYSSLRVVVSPSFLAALGELATGGAELVVGPLSRMSGMVEATARALRRVSPSVAVVVTVDASDAPEDREEAERAGFDAVMDLPVDPRVLLDLLPDAARDEPSGLDAGDEGSVPPLSGSPLIGGEPRHLPAGEDIGDVDLIDALLDRGSVALTAYALELVRGQSGLAEVGFAVDPESPPPGHEAAEVTYASRRLGALHAAAPATRGELEAWAAWFARWYALSRRFSDFEQQCLRDELTGVGNRRYFNAFFADVLRRAEAERRSVTLMVFDIDDFKNYNDRFGHPAGDEILRETARLMRGAVREHDAVARIGGDEFAVIFWDKEHAPRRPNSQHPHNVLKAARRFQQAVYAHKFPKLLDQTPGTLTISGGLASYPWDGRTADELLDHADAMALESKRQGKNAITFGPAALGEAQAQADAHAEAEAHAEAQAETQAAAPDTEADAEHAGSDRPR